MKVLKAFAKGIKLISVEVEDQHKDQRNLNRSFGRMKENIRISKDPDGKRLWFKKK